MKPILPRFRVTEAVFAQAARSSGPARFEAGSEIDLAFDAVPSAAMAPLNAPAVAAKAAAIRAYGVGRLRKPSAGDRSALITLTRSIGGSLGTVDEMVDRIELWLAAHPAPITGAPVGGGHD